MDPRLSSIEGRAKLSFALSIDLPDPKPNEVAGAYGHPLEVVRGLKQLARECFQLKVAASADNLDGFLESFEAARRRMPAIEVLAQRNRRRWAAAGMATNICVERLGRNPGSAHMGLLEWCREVLIAVAGAANVERLSNALEKGIPTRTSEEEIRENWQIVRDVLASLDDVLPHDYHPLIDAELCELERLATDPRADKTDKKTDTEKKLPPNDVNNCARYIRNHWALVDKGMAPKKTKKALIIEAVGEINWEAMDRQLRRYSDCLTLPDKPDK